MFLNERMPLAMVLGTYPACCVAVTISWYIHILGLRRYSTVYIQLHNIPSCVKLCPGYELRS